MYNYNREDIVFDDKKNKNKIIEIKYTRKSDIVDSGFLSEEDDEFSSNGKNLEFKEFDKTTML